MFQLFRRYGGQVVVPIALAGLGPLSVGGTYDTAVTLKENSCGAVTVQPNQTTVAHKAGEGTLTVTHAGNSYPGTVSPDGSFETSPSVLGGGEASYTISIAGKFSATGFEADVKVDVKQQVDPQSCGYVVHWVGTKLGGTNELPGKL